MPPPIEKVADVQVRYAPAGRIRIGYKDPSTGYPKKSSKLILTSKNRGALEAAAARYGGRVEAWEEPKSSDKWRLFTQVDEIPCLVTPAEEFRAYTFYEGGVRTRNCDGTTCMFKQRDGRWAESECICPKDVIDWKEARKQKKTQACQFSLDFSVWLEVGGMGTWRCVTSGFHAGQEIPPTMALLRQLTQKNLYVPASLVVEIDKSGEKTYPVIRIRILQNISEMMMLANSVGRAEMPMILTPEGISNAPRMIGGAVTRTQLEAPRMALPQTAAGVNPWAGDDDDPDDEDVIDVEAGDPRTAPLTKTPAVTEPAQESAPAACKTCAKPLDAAAAKFAAEHGGGNCPGCHQSATKGGAPAKTHDTSEGEELVLSSPDAQPDLREEVHRLLKLTHSSIALGLAWCKDVMKANGPNEIPETDLPQAVELLKAKAGK